MPHRFHSPWGLAAFAMVTLLASTALALKVDPPRGDFGQVAVESSGRIDFTITNDAVDVLMFETISLGADPDFGLNLQDLPFALGPGESVRLSASFTPPTRGSFTSEIDLDVSSLGKAVHVTIPLVGQGIGPAVSVNPPLLQWTSTAVGNGTGARTAHIVSDGELPVTLGDADLAIRGTNPNQFVLTGPGKQVTLMPGAALDVTVAYQPVSGGTHSARLEVAPAGVTAAICGLQGSAVSPRLWVGLGGPLRFDDVVLFSSSTPLKVGLKVPGDSTIPVDITGVTSSNPDFQVDLGQTQRHLEPGATTTIDVVFTPTRPGLATASIAVSVAWLSPIAVFSARGTGVVPADYPGPKLIPVAGGCTVGGAGDGRQPRSSGGSAWPLLLVALALGLRRARNSFRP